MAMVAALSVHCEVWQKEDVARLCDPVDVNHTEESSQKILRSILRKLNGLWLFVGWLLNVPATC